MMGGLQHMLVDVFTLLVTLLVPGLVWLLLVAGLFQLTVSKIRRMHIMPMNLRRTTHEGVS